MSRAPMTTAASLITSLALGSGTLAAPTRVFELSLAPTLSTGSSAAEASAVSLSLLGSNAARIDGFGLGLFASSPMDRVAGVQISGLVGMSGGSAFGLQVSGLGNLDRGDVYGLQIAGLSNVIGGVLYGLQVAGLANLQGGDLGGVQAAGLANVLGGDLYGLQLAGLSNIHGGEVFGGQVALINVGAQVRGVQIGLVNVADEVSGVQAGLVNISREMLGAPLGLVNIVGDGIFDLALWSDDVSAASVGLKYGSRHCYTLLRLGLRPLSDQEPLHVGAGLGGRLRLNRLVYMDTDASLGILYDPLRGYTPNALGQLRSTLGVRLLDQVALNGGVSLNSYLTEGEIPEQLSLVPATARMTIAPGPALAVWPGVHVGVAF